MIKYNRIFIFRSLNASESFMRRKQRRKGGDYEKETCTYVGTVFDSGNSIDGMR